MTGDTIAMNNGGFDPVLTNISFLKTGKMLTVVIFAGHALILANNEQPIYLTSRVSEEA